MPPIPTEAKNNRRAAAILGAIILFEGFFVVWIAAPNPHNFLTWTGFLPGRHTAAPAGYPAAIVVALIFILISAIRLPSVRANLIRPSWLKLLAIGVAVAAGILEELAFRPIWMNFLEDRGAALWLQVLLSGLGFGVVHGIWAFFGGSWRAGLGAITATTLLGVALALVFLAGGRSVAPCILAHFLLDLFVEPGLVLAALRGEMSRPNRNATP